MSFRPGIIFKILGGLSAIFLLMPLIAVIPFSFTPKRFLSLPKDKWSLRHYRSLFENPEWGESIMLSINVGLVASTLATILALMFALGLWMTRPRFAELWVGLALLPMIAPPVVSALTLYFFLNKLSETNDLIGYDTWLGVSVAHTVMVVPYAIVIITVALSQVDRKIDLAAKSMGAGLNMRLFHVILPNIRFGIVSAFLLCFVLSWDEIGVTLFITSIDAITLPRRMWMGLRDNIDPAIASLSVLLIMLVTVVIIGRSLWQLRAQK